MITKQSFKIKTNYYEKYKQCVGEVAFTDNIQFYGYEFPIYYDHKVKNYPLNLEINANSRFNKVNTTNKVQNCKYHWNNNFANSSKNIKFLKMWYE